MLINIHPDIIAMRYVRRVAALERSCHAQRNQYEARRTLRFMGWRVPVHV